MIIIRVAVVVVPLRRNVDKLSNPKLILCLIILRELLHLLRRMTMRSL